MGHPNEDVVRRGYDAFSRGDMETLREVFHPDVVWHAPGRGQLSGDYKGIDQVLGYFGETMDLTGGTFGVELHDVIGNDQHVVGLNSVHAERNGQRLDGRNALVFHVRDGRATEVWQFWGDQYAADEVLG